jgi:hypothetical protein
MRHELLILMCWSVLVTASCASDVDPRGTFHMLGDCAVSPPPGWSHCSARNRPWGVAL